MQEAARDQGSDEKTTNAILDHRTGHVYIVVGNHRTMADFEETVFHEVLGHGGVRALFGDAFVQEMNKLFMGLGGGQGLARIMEKRGMGDQFAEYLNGILQAREKNPRHWTDEMCLAILTDEVFAHIVEQTANPTLMDRFLTLVGMIREWLRRHQFMALSSLGTSDILALLRRGRQALGKPGPNGGGGGGVSVLSFAGMNAKTANKAALAAALSQLSEGANAEAVRQSTGWEHGRDGRMRFEVSDHEAKLRGLRQGANGVEYRSSVLAEVLDHPKLFAAYPALKSMLVNVTIDPSVQSAKGSFSAGYPSTEKYFGREPEITLVAPSRGRALTGLLHEVQHAIQVMEGFASGTNLEEAGSFENYQRTAGEVEARNVETRHKMSEEERRDIAPHWTTDVPESDIRLGPIGLSGANSASMVEQNAPRLAPNGKPSNLNARQWTEVRTPAFKRWFGDWERAELSRFLNGSPLMSLKTSDAPHQGFAKLREWALDVFRDAGNYASNPELGRVALDERGIRDSIGHRMSPFKAVAFKAVPEVIERGRIVHRETNAGVESFFISAPVVIDGKDDIVTVLVHRDPNTQRFYLHSVATKEYLLNRKQSGAPNESGGDPGAVRAGGVESILRDALTFNELVSQVVDENGEPLVVYHGTKSDIEAVHSHRSIQPFHWKYSQLGRRGTTQIPPHSLDPLGHINLR